LVEYRYELRRGEEVVATGRLVEERPFEVGERVVIGGRTGIARVIEPILGVREQRLVVQLLRDDEEPPPP
jgi:hypothetical protein